MCALLSVVALRTVCTHSSALRRPRWARVGRGSQRRERPVRHDVWYGTTHTYRLLSFPFSSATGRHARLERACLDRYGDA